MSPPASAPIACVLCAKTRSSLNIYLYSSHASEGVYTLLRQTLRFLSIGLGVEFHSLDTSSSGFPLAFRLCKGCDKIIREAQRLMGAFQELTDRIKTLVQASMRLDDGQAHLFGGNEYNTEKCRRFRQEICGPVQCEGGGEVDVDFEVKEELEWEIDPLVESDGVGEESESFATDPGPGTVDENDEDERTTLNVVPVPEDTDDLSHLAEGPAIKIVKIEHVEIKDKLPFKFENENEEEEDSASACAEDGEDAPFESESESESDSETESNQIPKKKPRKLEENDIDFKPVCCPICNEFSQTPKKYKRHLKSHNADNPTKSFIQCHFYRTCRRRIFGTVRLRIHELQEHSAELPYQCSTCGNQYFRKELLEAHSVVHQNQTDGSGSVTEGSGSGSQIYQCLICNSGETTDAEEKLKSNTGFPTKEKLEAHLILQHNWESNKSIKTFPCDICNRVFGSLSRYRDHLQTHRTEGLECDICNKKLKRHEALIKHLLVFHKEGSSTSTSTLFQCEKPNCDKKFQSKVLFEWHETVHKKYDKNRERWSKFNCEICSIPFRNEGKLQAHNNHWHSVLNKRQRRYNCPMEGCELKYTTTVRCVLVQHIRNCHPELLKFKCQPCNAEYYTEAFLKTHLNTHPDWNPSDGIFRCEVCTEKFLDRETLSGHLSVHNGDDHRKCAHCSKGFITNDTLLRHMRSEHGVAMPHKCDEKDCNASFLCKKNLLDHKKSRHPEPGAVRPFMCEVCSSCFYTEDSLTTHRRNKHTSRKPPPKPVKSVCEICGKLFSYMKGHMQKMHWGVEKKYKCYFCDQAYSSVFILNCHLYTHTKERPFICNKCGKDFNQAHCLKKHTCDAQSLRRNSTVSKRQKTGQSEFGIASFSGISSAHPANASMTNLSFTFPQAQTQQMMDFQQLHNQTLMQMQRQIPSGSGSYGHFGGNPPHQRGNYFNNYNVNPSNTTNTNLSNQNQNRGRQERLPGPHHPALDYLFN